MENIVRARLAIKENSWHYRLFKSLHKIWGTDNPSVSSLCTYVHFLTWVSLITLIVSPIIFIGWLCLKVERWLYKTSYSYPTTSKWTEGLDNSALKLGAFIDKQSERVENSFCCGCILNAFFIIAFIVIILCCLAIMTGAIGLLILNLFKIPFIVWGLVLGFASGLFIVCSWIGFVLSWIGSFLHSSIIVIGALLCSYGPSIAYWIGMILGFAASSMVVCYLVLVFFKTPMGKKITDFLVFKYNGFAKARQISKEREEEIKEQRAKAKSAKSEAKKKRPPSFARKIINAIFAFFFTGKEVKHKEKWYRSLNVFSLGWQFLMGVYKGVCPMVEVIKEDEK